MLARTGLQGLARGLGSLVVSLLQLVFEAYRTYREEDEVIRLISARTADRSERRQYSKRWKR